MLDPTLNRQGSRSSARCSRPHESGDSCCCIESIVGLHSQRATAAALSAAVTWRWGCAAGLRMAESWHDEGVWDGDGEELA
jgi:hypothetical protein